MRRPFEWRTQHGEMAAAGPDPVRRQQPAGAHRDPTDAPGFHFRLISDRSLDWDRSIKKVGATVSAAS